MAPIRVFFLTLIAVCSFASNSLLCRFALRQTRIDAATFTFVRIFSGAVVLFLVTSIRHRVSVSQIVTRLFLKESGTWLSAVSLILYTAAFTFAYNTLSAGTGALLLFGTVQATMILWGVSQGEKLHRRQLFGLALAFTGLVVLLFPGLAAPPVRGAILMIGAGVAWGVYSLRGKHEKNPVNATAGNFLCALPFAVVLCLVTLSSLRFDRAGITCAVVSGAITSGLAYIFWYKAVSALRAASAATVQLAVPVLTATGGILFLGEPITLRYVVASAAILGGIALVVLEATPSFADISPAD